ncbi:MarR family winged helix-turn-helix transcriptional regulator [Nocardioides sp. B-3]|uniref:MarR family winged helix-turn-helix transcriptional regulator n=1 Tax=Nocardioides sp. B-3 TaxID=2895565 RepID=UPI002152EB24|nr:MarR family transcriptional regulator [Nocardioides sp. B-3]UUZ60316.1 MarR family transcriptional regulator [Nocardioides sp. B-3]
MNQWAMVRPELDVSAMGVFGPLHRSFLLYRTQISEIFEQHGTNEAGFDVLASLQARGAGLSADGGRAGGADPCHHRGLTLRVNRLEQAGLVERRRDDVDNRVVYVTLTAAGKAPVDRVADAHFANERRMLRGLTAAQRVALAGLLGELEESLCAAVEGEPDDDTSQTA